MATISRSSVASVIVLTFIGCLMGLGSTTSWKTLTGKSPLVIARGGFSGLFPYSSSKAYEWAASLSLPNVVNWCDVQLTKDGVGICAPKVTLENSTIIDLIYKSGNKSYNVNGVATEGWFSMDYKFSELSNTTLIQGLMARPQIFDDNNFKLLTLDDVAAQFNTHGLWLNVQHDIFYASRGLNMSDYILSLARRTTITFISSPELDFLKSIQRSKPNNTKLVFNFNGDTNLEPSTNKSYVSLLRDLSAIKEFASGVIFPKEYIYNISDHIDPACSVVIDAHKAGLEVYSYSHSNDIAFGYDFGWDPIAEYLKFIDNGIFSVDGLISDFPSTASAAIACYSSVPKDAPAQAKPLVISSGGSSGFYTGCTKDSYLRAISDGVDILDCTVQLTSDGIPICLGSINLVMSTNAKMYYNKRAKVVPELGHGAGIYTFSLTWSEIQTLTPSLRSFCFHGKCLPRNPKYAKVGKFLTLHEFLDLASNSSYISGVLINIEHSLYLEAQQDLHVADAVLRVLGSVSGHWKMRRFMIQIMERSLLSKFKKGGQYELVYKIQGNSGKYMPIDILKDLVDSVVITKSVVYKEDAYKYVKGKTDTVVRLHAANLTVFVETFRNEFISQAYDYRADPYMEINSFAAESLVDAVITEYPSTAARYKRNRCLGLKGRIPAYMAPVVPGALRQISARDKFKGENDESPRHSKSKRKHDIIYWILGGLGLAIALFLMCQHGCLMLLEYYQNL